MAAPFKNVMKSTKAVSFGPTYWLGPSKSPIISTTTTIYPGEYPAGQAGYLFSWLGIQDANEAGDLIQGIVGSYPAGQSECSGSDADTAWCISSEVYGTNSDGQIEQFVGSMTTADVNYANGIFVNYTLVDASTHLWEQSMHDAVTGALLSSYSKTSTLDIALWNTEIECQDNNGTPCTGTPNDQYWVNSTIVLESADSSFADTLITENGATGEGLATADGGKTWTIDKITMPATA